MNKVISKMATLHVIYLLLQLEKINRENKNSIVKFFLEKYFEFWKHFNKQLEVLM